MTAIVAAAAIAAVFLGACSPAVTPTPAPTVPVATSTPAPIVLKDGLGREVSLAKPAQRVVSLAPSNTEILFAVGAGSQVVGREEFSNYPPEATAVPSIGSAMQLSTEAVVALQPDLVLAAGVTSPEQVKALEDLKITVFFLANPTDFDGLYQNMITAGKLTGHEAEARTLADSLKARVAAVTDKMAGAAKPKVFFEVDSTDPTKPWTVGPGDFIDTLITMAGGVNVASGLKSTYAQISSEELIQQNPDIILLGDAQWGTTAESVIARPGWEVIAAVKNQTIYPVDGDTTSRPGPRLVDGLEQLAKLLHPDLFK
jgi:iron complex transport system substrate-binding protein